jgi:hypothetical protein
LTVPTNQSIYVGQTLTVTNFATNTYLPGSKFTYSLPSSSTNYWISTNSGVLTWTNTAARPGTNTISVKVTDNSGIALPSVPRTPLCSAHELHRHRRADV